MPLRSLPFGAKAIRGARRALAAALAISTLAAVSRAQTLAQAPSGGGASRLPEVDRAVTAGAAPSSRRNAERFAQPLPARTRLASAEIIVPGVTEACTSLTLSDLENLALANNPTLVQAAARVQAAEGRWVQGGLRPNPIVGYQASEVGNSGTAGQQGAFLSQEFVRGGKLGLNRAIASREIAQMQIEFEAQRRRVLNDVRIEYYNVLVAQRARELAGEVAVIGKQALEVVEQQFAAEQVSQAEVLQARIESASAGIALQNAQNRASAAWRRLSSVIGSPGMSPTELAGELSPEEPALDWDQAYARLLAESPELASARAAVARARATLERASVQAVPNLDLQVGVQYDNSTQYTIGNVQAGVPVPFFDRNQGNVRTAYADLRNAQAEVGRLELALRSRLASAFETYTNARNQVEVFSKSILPDARSSLDIVNNGYRQGQVGFLALLTAQRTFFQANLAYLRALEEFNASRIAIEGLMLTGSLTGVAFPIDVPRPGESIAPVFGPGRPPVERK